MRNRTVDLPFHRADVLLVYGASGILVLTLGLIASSRASREAAARPATHAPSTAIPAAPAVSPRGFGVRPARTPSQPSDEPHFQDPLDHVWRRPF